MSDIAINILNKSETYLMETALEEIFNENTYSFEISAEYTVIDIGAFIGGYTAYAAKKAQRVISFEPNPESFLLAQKNIRLNNLNNVELYQMCVAGGSDKRELTIYLHSPNQGGANLYGCKSLTNFWDFTSAIVTNNDQVKNISVEALK